MKFIFIVASILVFSCNQNNIQNSSKVDSSDVINPKQTSIVVNTEFIDMQDTIIKGFFRDIPQGSKGDIPAYKSVQKYLEYVKLNNLINGFDSLCIRLWYGYSFDIRKQVIEITKRNNNWEAKYILLTGKYGDLDSLISIEKYTELKIPKSGWKKFTEKVCSSKIMELKDQYLAPRSKVYAPSMDGDGVTIEIATNKLYRIYSYKDPRKMIDVEEAKQIVSLMQMICDELNFTQIREF